MAYKRSRKAFEEDLQKRESPFVVYGTPLPPLDEDVRDDGSYVPVWKQEVTDDRGRKRLHGAFTGGFSAGYFNTVGSKEGWAPSTFVSSRSNRAKDQKQSTQPRPEDFMDEEDIREQEESRQIATASGFAGFGTEDDPLHQNRLLDLFRPSNDSMGVKLLNKMGWKQGQGIGPRIRRKVEGDEQDAETYLLPPDDAPMISFSRKHDFKGLGHNGDGKSIPAENQSVDQSNGNEEDEDRPGLSFVGRKKKPSKQRQGGFGVGVLNDTGSDEEDPYSMGPKISYNKTVGSDKKAKKKTTIGIGSSNPLLKSKPLFVPKKLSSLQNALRKCHDGRLPLTGFVLADELDRFSNMSLTDERYKPPEVPEDWKLIRALAGDDATTIPTDKTNSTYQSTYDVAKQSTHDAASRAALLGEQKLPGKSIFDFMTPEAREKLMKASGKTNLPPALSERLPDSEYTSSTTDNQPGINVPYLDAVTAKSALSRAESGGFMPYAEDLDKRQRYKHFLELSTGTLPDGTSPMKPPNTTRAEDWQNELHEFVRAAEVFRPMTGAIASRFTSSSSSSLKPNINTLNTNGTSADDLVRKPATKPEDPAEVAARLGVFGIMTRSVSSFQPIRLVCKRFGVDMPIYMPQEASQQFTPSSSTPSMQPPMPQNAAAPLGKPHSDVPLSDATRDTSKSVGFITNGKDEAQAHATTSTAVDSSTNIMTSELRGPDMDTNTTNIDPDRNEALEQERPGHAVFKAIFGDSDSDDN